MADAPVPPFRYAFDNARDPLTARNALGITSTGGGGTGFITAVTPPLQVTGTTLSIDLSAYQPLDADLTAIAALTGTNTIYYRSAANTWSAVTVGTGLSFSGGTLAASGGGGTPGGSTTQVQYNNAGAFGGAANLTWNNGTSVLNLIGQLAISSANPTNILAAGIVQSTGFKVTGTLAFLSPENPGVVGLRPNGLGSSTGQLSVAASGAVTVAGPVNLPADPTTALQAATKQMVDAKAPVGAEYITSTADATLTSERVLTDTATVTWDRTTAGQIKANATGGGGTTVLPGPPQGRLTLTTATPVMTATVSGANAIRYTPYCGNLLPIYDGSTMIMTTFAELTCATADATKNPAAIGASKVNDWFVWNDAGTMRLTHGPDWTSDTARSAGTALVMVNGILLNNAAITNGPAASRGTYVGTTRSNASSTLDWIFGGLATNGSAAVFDVWNAYNRVDVSTSVQDSSATWTYTTQTWRAAHGSTTMRASYVCGLAEDGFNAAYTGAAGNSIPARWSCGVGIDSTSVFSGMPGSITSAGNSTAVALVSVPPAIGFHYVSALEWSTASGTTTWIGTGAGGDIQNGMLFLGRF